MYKSLVVVLAAGLAAFFLTTAVAQRLPPGSLERCNLEGFLAYEIAMWRDLDVTIEQARERIAKRHPKHETDPGQLLNMMFMDLAAQAIYRLQTLEPIDLSIAFYNGCRQRSLRLPGELAI